MLKYSTKFFTGIGSLLCMALLPTIAFSADDDMARRKAEYDCQEKAAEFTKNMGSPGDTALYKKHYSQCMELTAKPEPKLRMQQGACAAMEHPFKFVNKSGETIWIGVWEDFQTPEE